MTTTGSLGDDRQLAGVIAAALRLAGAAMSTTSDGVHEADLPAAARIHFGNRPRLRYALDRTVRQYHADVEVVTPGSALVTQAIQFIRENTSVVYRMLGGQSSAPDPQVALRPLFARDLPLRVIGVDRLQPDLCARAQILVTLQSDDRRSFLHEVVVPLNIPAERRTHAVELQAATVVASQAEWPLPATLRDIVGMVLDAADVDVKPRIQEREADIEAVLQEASRRLPRQALDALRRDLVLRVELDVAVLELTVLHRLQYRAALSEPGGRRELTFALEAYEDETLATKCPVCRSESRHLDACLSSEMHLVCPVCGIRCTSCGARRCRKHPLSECPDPSCHGSFCEQCSEACGQCGRNACAVHRAKCSLGCGTSACSQCQAQCVFEPGLPMHSSHLQTCRDCGRSACINHLGECGLEAPGSAAVCIDDLVACEFRDHDLEVCQAHRGVCAGCDKRVCKQHATACADCGRPGCPDDAGPCAVGREWVLHIHSRRCADCDEPACATHSVECARCHKVFCSRHATVCALGTEPLCLSDALRCSQRGEATCVEHSVVCSVGPADHVVCDRDACRAICVEDSAAVCLGHVLACDRGHEPLCPAHGERCVQGGERLCPAHRVACPVDGQSHCTVHAATCVICGSTTCLACTTTPLGSGGHACDACLGPSVEASPTELRSRPLVVRILAKSPIVVRSGGGTTLISVSRLRCEAQTSDASGQVIGQRRLDAAIARAYLDARRARHASKPPTTS